MKNFLLSIFVVGSNVFATSQTMSSTEIDEMDQIIEHFAKDFAYKNRPETIVSEEMLNVLVGNLREATRNGKEPVYVDYFKEVHNELLRTLIKSTHIESRAELQALAGALEALYSEICENILHHIGEDLSNESYIDTYYNVYIPSSLDDFFHVAISLTNHFDIYTDGLPSNSVECFKKLRLTQSNHATEKKNTPIWKKSLFAHIAAFATFMHYLSDSSTLSALYDKFLAAQEGFTVGGNSSFDSEDITESPLIHALVDPSFATTSDAILGDSKRYVCFDYIKPLAEALAKLHSEPSLQAELSLPAEAVQPKPSLFHRFLRGVLPTCCCCCSCID